jgi:D-serine deaminase-like pyridoxal phosphate-dependent protein
MTQIGIDKNEIDTPALLIDLDLMEKNIATMADYFKGKKAKLRAHTKVHRTPIIAHKQIEAGAKGICCQKVGEAEVMAASGIKNILVSNEIVSPTKIERLVALNKSANISAPVDNPSVAESIAKAARKTGLKFNLFVDIHMGSGRCGVEPGEPALKLAKRIKSLEGVELMGLMGFEGHLSHMEPREKRKKQIEKHEAMLVDTKKLIEISDIGISEIYNGSTGTYDVSAIIPQRFDGCKLSSPRS